MLIVLGVLTIAGGTVFGAGAFSQVQADRTVTASTADDANANLQLEANSTSYTGTQNGELTIDMSSLNGNATTTVDHAINVTANPPDGSGTYDIYVQDGANVGPDAEIDFEGHSAGTTIVGSTNATQVSAGTQVDLRIRVDLTGSNDVSNVPNEITIVATEA